MGVCCHPLLSLPLFSCLMLFAYPFFTKCPLWFNIAIIPGFKRLSFRDLCFIICFNFAVGKLHKLQQSSPGLSQISRRSIERNFLRLFSFFTFSVFSLDAGFNHTAILSRLTIFRSYYTPQTLDITTSRSIYCFHTIFTHHIIYYLSPSSTI